MKKLVIFDLDGTLVNSLNSIAYCGNYALEKLGFKAIDPEEYKFLAGDGVNQTIRKMLYKSGDTEYANFENARFFFKKALDDGAYLYQVNPFDGIKELLNKLKSDGIKIAVLSNKLHIYTCKLVDEVFGKNFFDSVRGQTPDVPRKPSPQGAFLICDENDISTSDAVYVGDTSTDMITGKDAKMLTVGVAWGFRSVEELINYGADYVVHNPLEIVDIVHNKI